MSLPEFEPLNLLWWNTALSPLGKSRASADEKKYVASTLADLWSTANLSLIGLGEVCSDDIENIIGAIDDKDHLSFHDATMKHGRSKFDIAVIFDRRRLRLVEFKSLLSSYANITLKIGERLHFVSLDTGDNFHLFVSHWPGRGFYPELSAKRREIGTALRGVLDELRRSGSGQQYMVLMGDYNDDPFSPALAEHLLATRDRELANTNDSFLYNPFWRNLGDSKPFSYGQEIESICGTYYYSSGVDTRWFTFDQIMFSSAFLRGGRLMMNEEKSSIIWDEDMKGRVKGSKWKFDHFPVLGTIDIREGV